jgi:hypothetical protein
VPAVQLIDQCRASIALRLLVQGWTRPVRRKDYFELPGPPGPLTRRLAARATYQRGSGTVVFLPAVGISLLEVAEIRSSLLRLPAAGDRYVSVIGRSLMDLLPADDRNLNRWRITREADIDQVVGSVTNDISQYGIPFLEQFDTRESVTLFLEQSKRSMYDDWTLAILYALSGSSGQAFGMLRDSVGKGGSLSPEAADDAVQFAEAFAEHFGISEEFEAYRRASPWPLSRPQASSKFVINVRQPEVARKALLGIGRHDVAERARELTEDQLAQISARSSEIFQMMQSADERRVIGKDIKRAIAQATSELLDQLASYFTCVLASLLGRYAYDAHTWPGRPIRRGLPQILLTQPGCRTAQDRRRTGSASTSIGAVTGRAAG